MASKKKNKSANKHKPGSKAEVKNSAKSRRKLLKTGLISVGVIALAGGGLSMYRASYALSHDLSVIGQGRPTVVQIHDPSCPKCNKLKDNTAAVKGDFENINFRIANLKSREGASFARRFGVGKITLLIFDGEGNLVENLHGIQPKDRLRRLFAGL